MNEQGLLVGLVNLVLVVTALEIAWLMFRRGGVRLAKWPLLANLLAGLSLVLALRLSLAGVDWFWIALCLALAGLAHVVDLQARWRDAKSRV